MFYPLVLPFRILFSALLLLLSIYVAVPAFGEEPDNKSDTATDAIDRILSSGELAIDGVVRAGNTISFQNGVTVIPTTTGLTVELPGVFSLHYPIYLSPEGPIEITDGETGEQMLFVGDGPLSLAIGITLNSDFTVRIWDALGDYWIFPDGKLMTPSGVLLFADGPNALTPVSGSAGYAEVSDLTGIDVQFTNAITTSSTGQFPGSYLDQPYFEPTIDADSGLCNDEGPACCCPKGENAKAKTLVITVHGVNSDGSEWGEALAKLDESQCIEVVEFKYNDWRCLGSLVKDLKKFVLNQKKEGEWCKVIVLAHSAGGLLASRLSSDREAAPDETHTMATPLKGAGYGPPVFLVRPFIGCLKAQIGKGLDRHPKKKDGTKVKHHKTGKEDKAVENRWMKGSQDGNDVPGSTTQEYPDDDHISIITSVVDNLQKDGTLPDCE